MYLCIKVESYTLILSKDMAWKQFFVCTYRLNGGTGRTNICDTIWPPIENGDIKTSQNLVSHFMRSPTICNVVSHYMQCGLPLYAMWSPTICKLKSIPDAFFQTFFLISPSGYSIHPK